MESTERLNLFLIECGLDKYVKNDSDLDIKLFHDLDFYGDVAESCIELLRDKYGVDTSYFIFEDYFPDEFPGNTQFQKVLVSLIPFLRKKHVDKSRYKPFTFNKIKCAIASGRLT
ncbi:hypothetical protein C2869_12255 [Saccharobesus litoralis]|uniref:DUF1493 family protein n=1 Tax=Saccharobesus litoralis TaxID=2172099 RepID=A0A2S0VST0_9ALTE|nr:DUF1493 family protein [Saccharobesus litoralis]AWB67160.1 hypothetical protein C2869_12255 [Saccharobesus litoralis]